VNEFNLSCPCHFGLESVLAGEMKRQGFEQIRSENGRVFFAGGYEHVARANIQLRTAERVQIVLGTFTAKSFEELFEATRKLPFEQFVSQTAAFPVTGYALNSQLASVPDCQAIIKKAAVTRLQEYYGISWFEETGPKVRIQFSILKDEVRIMLDTSGVGLHKRGYRQNGNIAPIKETLAAGIIGLARIYNDSVVYDPFCGSGTLLIEAAIYAHSIAPGLRRRFSFEDWECVDPAILAGERSRAMDMIDKTATFAAYGSDIDPAAIELTRANAKKAGVSSKIALHQADIKDFHFYDDTKKAVVITNPPYGERLLDVQAAERLYVEMGKKFVQRRNTSYYVITPHEEFERLFGRKGDKRRKLYNGMMKCQLYMYFKPPTC